MIYLKLCVQQSATGWFETPTVMFRGFFSDPKVDTDTIERDKRWVYNNYASGWWTWGWRRNRQEDERGEWLWLAEAKDGSGLGRRNDVGTGVGYPRHRRQKVWKKNTRNSIQGIKSSITILTSRESGHWTGGTSWQWVKVEPGFLYCQLIVDKCGAQPGARCLELANICLAMMLTFSMVLKVQIHKTKSITSDQLSPCTSLVSMVALSPDVEVMTMIKSLLY